METQQSVWEASQTCWEQIEEEKLDYQYFKARDNEKLQQTLEALKKLGIDKNE